MLKKILKQIVPYSIYSILKNQKEDLKDMLELKGFETEFSKGLTLWGAINDNAPPFVRKTVIRAKKGVV